MSTIEENKAVVRAFMDALGKSDVQTVGNLLSKNVTAICTGTSVLSGTRDYADLCGIAGSLSMVTRGGIHFELLNLTAEDDRVACESQGHCTLANGSPYNNQYHFLYTVRDGKITEMKEYMDTKLVDSALGPLLQAASGD